MAEPSQKFVDEQRKEALRKYEAELKEQQEVARLNVGPVTRTEVRNGQITYYGNLGQKSYTTRFLGEAPPSPVSSVGAPAPKAQVVTQPEPAPLSSAAQKIKEESENLGRAQEITTGNVLSVRSSRSALTGVNDSPVSYAKEHARRIQETLQKQEDVKNSDRNAVVIPDKTNTLGISYAIAPKKATINRQSLRFEERTRILNVNQRAKRDSEKRGQSLNTQKEIGGLDGTTRSDSGNNNRDNLISGYPNDSLLLTLPVKQKGFLENLQERAIREREKAETERLRNNSPSLKLAAMSVGTGFLGSAIFAKQLVTSPLKTTKELFLGAKEVGRRVVTGEGFPEAGQALRQTPEKVVATIGTQIAVGTAAGKVLQVFGSKLPKPAIRTLELGEEEVSIVKNIPEKIETTKSGKYLLIESKPNQFINVQSPLFKARVIASRTKEGISDIPRTISNLPSIRATRRISRNISETISQPAKSVASNVRNIAGEVAVKSSFFRERVKESAKSITQPTLASISRGLRTTRRITKSGIELAAEPIIKGSQQARQFIGDIGVRARFVGQATKQYFEPVGRYLDLARRSTIRTYNLGTELIASPISKSYLSLRQGIGDIQIRSLFLKERVKQGAINLGQPLINRFDLVRRISLKATRDSTELISKPILAAQKYSRGSIGQFNISSRFVLSATKDKFSSVATPLLSKIGRAKRLTVSKVKKGVETISTPFKSLKTGVTEQIGNLYIKKKFFVQRTGEKLSNILIQPTQALSSSARFLKRNVRFVGQSLSSPIVSASKNINQLSGNLAVGIKFKSYRFGERFSQLSSPVTSTFSSGIRATKRYFRFGADEVVRPFRDIGLGIKNTIGNTRIRTRLFGYRLGKSINEGLSPLTKGVDYSARSVRRLGYGLSESVSKPFRKISDAIPFEVKIKDYGSRISRTSLPLTKTQPSDKIYLFGFETPKGRAVTIGAKTSEGFSFGTPNLKKQISALKEGADIKVGSALETKALIKTFKSLPEESLVNVERGKKALPVQQELIRQAGNTKSSFIKDLPTQTERLTPEGVKTVLKVGKEEKGVLFGSFSRQAQLSPEFNIKGQVYKLDKSPRDIEFRFDTAGPEDLQRITDKTIVGLRAKGYNAREIKDTPFAIEVKQPSGRFEKAVEFKGAEEIIEGERVPEFVLGIRKVGKPIKLQGIKATGLAEELRGVTQGVARVTRKGDKFDIYPPPKRQKDIGSVVVSARTLEQSKLFGRERFGRTIEEFESLYPDSLTREQLKLEEPIKVQIGDFRDSPSSPITPLPVAQSQIFPSPSSRGPSQTSKTVYSNLDLVSPKSKTPPSPRNYFKSYSSNSSSKSQSISKSASSSVSNIASNSFSKSSSSSKSSSVSSSLSPSPSTSTSISPSKSVSPSISKSLSPSPSRSVSPSPSRSVSPSPSRSVSPSSSVSTSPYPIPTSPFGSSTTRFPLDSRKDSIQRNQAFDVFLRRGGEFFKIGSGLPQGKALKLGEGEAKRTLAATFKLVPKGFTQQKDIDFRVGEEFRNFQIRQGKRVETPLQFIQKSEFRLSSQTERSEISKFRKLRIGA